MYQQISVEIQFGSILNFQITQAYPITLVKTAQAIY